MRQKRQRRRRQRRRPVVAPVGAGSSLVVATALGLVVDEHGSQVARLLALAEYRRWAHVCERGTMRHDEMMRHDASRHSRTRVCTTDLLLYMQS
jgi:hypothetical protein